jgi:hypothetical protein
MAEAGHARGPESAITTGSKRADVGARGARRNRESARDYTRNVFEVLFGGEG